MKMEPVAFTLMRGERFICFASAHFFPFDLYSVLFAVQVRIIVTVRKYIKLSIDLMHKEGQLYM